MVCPKALTSKPSLLLLVLHVSLGPTVLNELRPPCAPFHKEENGEVGKTQQTALDKSPYHTWP